MLIQPTISLVQHLHLTEFRFRHFRQSIENNINKISLLISSFPLLEYLEIDLEYSPFQDGLYVAELQYLLENMTNLKAIVYKCSIDGYKGANQDFQEIDIIHGTFCPNHRMVPPCTKYTTILHDIADYFTLKKWNWRIHWNI